jgi:hypothetical protein
MAEVTEVPAPTVGLADYFKYGLKVFDSLLPIAEIFLSFFPPATLPIAAVKVIQNLPNIIGLAERALEGSTGAEKKEFAIQTAQAMASSIEGVSTGGQAETWAKIGAIVPDAIDKIVAVINTFEETPATALDQYNKSVGG